MSLDGRGDGGGYSDLLPAENHMEPVTRRDEHGAENREPKGLTKAGKSKEGPSVTPGTAGNTADRDHQVPVLKNQQSDLATEAKESGLEEEKPDQDSACTSSASSRSLEESPTGHGENPSVNDSKIVPDTRTQPRSNLRATARSDPNNFGDGDGCSDVKSKFSTRSHDNRLVWIATLIILTCYIAALITLPSVTTQYFNYRIAKDDYNITLKPEASRSKCTNSTGPRKKLLNSVQQEAARIVLMSTLASGISTAVACLVVGSYSDFLGRRFLMVACILGGLVKVGLFSAVVRFDLPLQLFYLGSFVDGATGSFLSMTLTVTAVIADITPVPQGRAFRFAILEGTLLTAGALAQLAVGFIIKTWGYFVPTAISICILGLALLLALFLMPETMRKPSRERFTWSPAFHIRKVFGFYFIKDSTGKRPLYILCMGIYLLITLTNMGRIGVETLFVLNAPICWRAIDIGIFHAVRLVVCSVTALLVLKTLRSRLSLEAIGIMSVLSAAASFIVESLATNGTLLYLTVLVGILFTTAIPIPRALISQLTSPAQQGALFSSLAVAEAIGNMAAGVAYTSIYNSTLNVFKGAVFILMAAMCLGNVCLLGTFWRVRRGRLLLTDSETDAPVINDEGSSGGSQSVEHAEDQHKSSEAWEGEVNEKTFWRVRRGRLLLTDSETDAPVINDEGSSGGSQSVKHAEDQHKSSEAWEGEVNEKSALLPKKRHKAA
ncbi:solute carrier family 46 member 3-like [Plakobranchus ocellatus]|uniref:Solute carrier family 46 member 3-like n=1 Tax=Plakobranchus ocellatus TaxID=259542 RepID=A0AAV4DYN2_9GAST|nr:solute carrier family 46 member 3-like [Plakobranchus ocellatus]